MKARCYNKKNKSYSRYGGRRIKVCRRWLGSFTAFFEDMGMAGGMTIERRNNNLGYSANNCLWIPKAGQMINTSRNRIITFNGSTMPLCKWAIKTGIKAATIRRRLVISKWSVKRALTTAV